MKWIKYKNNPIKINYEFSFESALLCTCIKILIFIFKLRFGLNTIYLNSIQLQCSTSRSMYIVYCIELRLFYVCANVFFYYSVPEKRRVTFLHILQLSWKFFAWFGLSVGITSSYNIKPLKSITDDWLVFTWWYFLLVSDDALSFEIKYKILNWKHQIWILYIYYCT